MPNQIRDHRRAAWMVRDERGGLAHLVHRGDQSAPELALAQRATLCGRRKTDGWRPYESENPGAPARCRRCLLWAAKRMTEIVTLKEND